MLTGQNGILNRATDATIENEIGTVTESIELYLTQKIIDAAIDGKEESSIATLKKAGIIDDDNVINTKQLLGTKTKYGNGNKEKDVYKIIGDKLIYIDSTKNKVSERDIYILTNDFITRWNIEAGDEIYLPIACKETGGAEDDNNFTVDWGDGTKEKVMGLPEKRPSHIYEKAGKYEISISGTCKYFTFDTLPSEYNEEKSKLVNIIKWGEIECCKYNFEGAINLEGSIPSPQENSFINVKKDHFDYMFSDCKKIETIPSDLFANISNEVISFVSTFDQCESLKEIPENLFEKAVNVNSFYATFRGCKSLTFIPEKLFDKTTKVTTFQKTFCDCYNVRAIPNALFDNVPNITDFSLTFGGLNKVTSVPELWKRTTEGIDGSRCFENCNSVDKSKLDITPEKLEVWF
ncbi:MAG: hypothetical protein V8R39_00725 [Clostridia bacterium]